MNTGKRLKLLREEKGLSQEDVAKLIGVGRTTYLKYETGENKPTRKLKELSELFNVTADYILGISPIKHPEIKKAPIQGVKIPVLGSIVAGIPVSAIEDILDYEEITPDLATRGNFFALQVKGDSMSPKILDGDIVIIREQPDVDCGDIAVVLVNGDEATLKQVKKTDDGIMLIGYNLAVYSPHFYSQKDIQTLPVQIIGKAVEIRRNL